MFQNLEIQHSEQTTDYREHFGNNLLANCDENDLLTTLWDRTASGGGCRAQSYLPVWLHTAPARTRGIKTIYWELLLDLSLSLAEEQPPPMGGESHLSCAEHLRIAIICIHGNGNATDYSQPSLTIHQHPHSFSFSRGWTFGSCKLSFLRKSSFPLLDS